MNPRQVVATVLVFAVALLATVSQAADPKSRIDVKPQYELYEPIIATVDQEATVYFWDYPETFQAIELDNGRTLHIWAPPGEHHLKCLLLTIDWEAKTVTKASLYAEFIVGEPGPLPSEKKQVVIMINPTRRDNLRRSQQMMLASLTFRGRLKAAGHQLVGIVDREIKDKEGNTHKSLIPFRNACGTKPLPQLCTAPLGGGRVTCVPLPLTEAEVLDTLTRGSRR